MRKQLFYDPLLFIERLGMWATEKRRLRKLRKTVAASLKTGHIGSLELLELLKPSEINVIYDIGANVGTWTLLAKSIFPQAEVHAFEPLQQHSVAFRATTRSLSNVHLHQIALGDCDGHAEMNVMSFSDASSILHMQPEISEKHGIKAESIEKVPLERLDGFIERKNLPNPDIIKLDIQGYELVALTGAKAALNCSKAVITEVSFCNFYSGQADFHKLVSFLADHGFSISAFGHGIGVAKELTQADVLFVKTCTIDS